MANNTSSNATTLPTSLLRRSCNFHRFTEIERWLQVSSFLIIVVVSMFGNTVVISIIKKNRRLHSPTNYFIVNLCFTNLLILLLNTTPDILSRIVPSLGFAVSGLAGMILCKLQGFLTFCTVNAAILTLAVIAADRFIAIFFPLRRAISSRKAVWLIAAAWVAPALPGSIFLYVYRIIEFKGKVYCIEKWEPLIPDYINTVISAADFIVFYTLPLLEIIILYSAIIYKIWVRKIPGQVTTANQQLELKAKKNVLKMLVIAVLTFALFWLPMKIVMVILTLGNLRCFRSPTLAFLTLFLGCINCAINPFIYIVFSRDYRNGFKAVFHCPSFRGGGKLPYLHSRSVEMTEMTNCGRQSDLSLGNFKKVDNF